MSFYLMMNFLKTMSMKVKIARRMIEMIEIETGVKVMPSSARSSCSLRGSPSQSIFSSGMSSAVIEEREEAGNSRSIIRD